MFQTYLMTCVIQRQGKSSTSESLGILLMCWKADCACFVKAAKSLKWLGCQVSRWNAWVSHCSRGSIPGIQLLTTFHTFQGARSETWSSKLSDKLLFLLEGAELDKPEARYLCKNHRCDPGNSSESNQQGIDPLAGNRLFTVTKSRDFRRT